MLSLVLNILNIMLATVKYVKNAGGVIPYISHLILLFV